MSSVVSVFTRHTYLRSISQVASIIFMTGIFYFVLAALRTKAVFYRAIGVYIAVAGAISLVGLYLYLCVRLGYGGIVQFVTAAAGGTSPVWVFCERGERIQGFFTEPLTFGTYLVSAIPLTLAGCFFRAWRRYRLFLILALFMQLAALALTLSRGAWLGGLAAVTFMLAVLAFVRYRARRILSVVAITVIIAVVSVFVLHSTPLSDRFSSWAARHPFTRKLKELTVDQFMVMVNIRKYAAMSRENCSVAADFFQRQITDKAAFSVTGEFRKVWEQVTLEGFQNDRRVVENSGPGAGWVTEKSMVSALVNHEDNVAALPSLPNSITQLSWSTGIRLNDIAAGIFMFRDHPVLGVGWGNYIFRYLDYDPQLMGWWWTNDPQTNNRPGTPILPNLFISILAESGILGFLFFVVFIFSLFRQAIESVTRLPLWDDKLIAGSLAAALTGILVGYQFFSTFYYAYVWMIMAFIVSFAIDLRIGNGIFGRDDFGARQGERTQA